MLSNCEKLLLIPPTTNEWPQPQQITHSDDQKVSMASSTGGRVMEKPGQELLQQQQQALKCPRCDSSNTKFCYYNNYSLSQPRHFCKACKRYWTRGGTLRNVPVGGGCRKNKRVKRPISSSAIDAPASAPSSSSSAPSANSNPVSQPQIDISSSSNHMNPLFYGLTSTSCEMNLPFPRFNSRVETISGYDHLQSQLNDIGLGYSSGVMSNGANDNGYRNGFSSNNALLSSYSIFGGSSSSSTPTTPIMASLLSSTLQQKFTNGGVKDAANIFHGFAPLEEMNNSEADAEMVGLKEVKVEGGGQNRFESWNGACQNQMDQHVGLSDPSSLYWNAASTAMGGAWNDPTNIGPSVTSLI
ncbi:hypothetical protein L6164_032869 [Bauhinia variegata]|uniref:Uncharacterized protein n=1 Tax=Bauhinia variegata TaxID=167791 RepID=A0ACB9KQ48_BAUVA|nr:hypothetical protein L6164_032869 [Bauhinia variegata]